MIGERFRTMPEEEEDNLLRKEVLVMTIPVEEKEKIWITLDKLCEEVAGGLDMLIHADNANLRVIAKNRFTEALVELCSVFLSPEVTEREVAPTSLSFVFIYREETINDSGKASFSDTKSFHTVANDLEHAKINFIKQHPVSTTRRYHVEKVLND